jgi:hypothetical protein
VGLTSDGNSVLANPQAQNSYSYANNNPINMSDKSGRMSDEAFRNPASSLIQAAVWSAGSYALGNYNAIGQSRPISESLMNHSLSMNPQSISIDESNQGKYGNVVDALKNSNHLNGVIQTAIKNNNKEIFSKDGFSYDKLNFAQQGGDLFTAIGKANLNLQGNKKTGEITVKVSDTYNYEYSNKGYSDSKVFGTLNNAAAVSQKTGVISPYSYSVSYKTKSKNK